MTKYEKIITELATDIKWMKQSWEENARANNLSHKEMIEHLSGINGTVASTKTSTRNLWVVVSGIFTLLVGVSVALIQVASHVGG